MKNILLKISIIDKVTAPIQKMHKTFQNVQKSVTGTQRKLKLLPNSIQSLENKLTQLRHKQKQAFTVEGIKKYKNKIRQTEKELSKLNRKAGITKNSLSNMFIGGASIYAAFSVGKDVINSWDIQQQAIAQVNQGLLTTQGVSGKTLDQLETQASALQKTSLFGDEDILQNVSAQLLTFTNITGDAFDRTQQAALDLSARLGTDLKSSSIQLGKALNDPVANLSALSRSGIQFSDEQKELIKSLWATGQQAEAQSIILGELETQFGGSAAAAAKAGAGPLKQLQMRFGDLKEHIGGLLMTLIDKLMPVFEKIISFLEKTATFVEENARVIGIVIGVITSIVAITKAWSVAQQIAATATKMWTAFQWLLNLAMEANPIGLIIIGVAALIGLLVLAWKKSEKFRATVTGLWEAMKAFGTLLKDVVLNALKSLLSSIGKMGQALWAFFKGDYKQAFEYAKQGAVDFAKGTSIGVAYDLVQNKDKVTNAFSVGYDNGITNFRNANANSNNQQPANNNPLGVMTPADIGGGNNTTTGIIPGNPTQPVGDSQNISSITGGGTRPTNITVTFDKLIETLSIAAENVEMGIDEMETKLTEALTRVLNSAAEIAT